MAGKKEALRGATERMSRNHDTSEFDCGVPRMNRFLREFAMHAMSGGTGVTHVICRGNKVAGYYTLSTSSVRRGDLPRRAQGHLANPVPAILLARLAVDVSEQGGGIGSSLVRDALLKSLTAIEVMGARLLWVDAIEDSAVAFYQSIDFRCFEPDCSSRRLYVLFKDVVKTLGADIDT